jgi:Uma2 family endonuclease
VAAGVAGRARRRLSSRSPSDLTSRPVSAAHAECDIDETVAAFDRVVQGRMSADASARGSWRRIAGVSTELRFTVSDLELLPLPLDDTRYELVDGELYVSRQPHWQHQRTCDQAVRVFDRWDPDERRGVLLSAPGLIFSREDAVAPDLVWISRERFARVVHADGKLHAAPDLVVEVLSPGRENEERDREIKLRLYSRRGVREYWIVDWQAAMVAVYRRENVALELVATLTADDPLTSPLLPGFGCPVRDLCAAPA